MNGYMPYTPGMMPAGLSHPMDIQNRIQQLQQMQQQFQAVQQPQVPQQNGIVWVQGIAGAKSYIVSPGTSALLMDSDDNILYLKSADSSGMPSLRMFRYEEVKENKNQNEGQNNKEFVERKEFENFKNNVLEIINQSFTKPGEINMDVQE